MNAPVQCIEDHPEPTRQRRRGPGRGVGEKRLMAERLAELKALFEHLLGIHRFLGAEGHRIINESGTMLAPQVHQNLDDLIVQVEDFLWMLNAAIAQQGGQPRLI